MTQSHFNSANLAISPKAEITQIVSHNGIHASTIDIRFSYDVGSYEEGWAFVKTEIEITRDQAQDLVDVLTAVLANPEPAEGEVEIIGDDEVAEILDEASRIRLNAIAYRNRQAEMVAEVMHDKVME